LEPEKLKPKKVNTNDIAPDSDKPKFHRKRQGECCTFFFWVVFSNVCFELQALERYGENQKVEAVS
jgi:hypothetical protein